MTYWDGARWVPEPSPRAGTRPRVLRRFLGAGAEAALITLLMFGFIAGTTLAAKGGGNGGNGKQASASVSLVLLDSSDGYAHHTHRVAFEVLTNATDRPFVGVRCYQNSTWVLDAYTGSFDTYMFDPWVTLDSNYWIDGHNATCTARVFAFDKRGNQDVLAELNFEALP